MSIQAFCAWAGIGRTKVYEEIEAGRLSTVKVGRRRLVPMQQAQLWLEGLADG
jgi:excisionase family DNA binding protein